MKTNHPDNMLCTSRREARAILAYLHVLINPSDDASLRRIINIPSRGITKTTIERFSAAARRTGSSLYRSILEPEHLDIANSAYGKLRELIINLEIMRRRLDTMTLTEIVHHVIQIAGYRNEELNDLLLLAKDFQGKQHNTSLNAFIDHIASIDHSLHIGQKN